MPLLENRQSAPSESDDQHCQNTVEYQHYCNIDDRDCRNTDEYQHQHRNTDHGASRRGVPALLLKYRRLALVEYQRVPALRFTGGQHRQKTDTYQDYCNTANQHFVKSTATTTTTAKPRITHYTCGYQHCRNTVDQHCQNTGGYQQYCNPNVNTPYRRVAAMLLKLRP